MHSCLKSNCESRARKMRLEPIFVYIYINGEIIQSSSANVVFRGDKTKIVTIESYNDTAKHNHRNTVINYR